MAEDELEKKIEEAEEKEYEKVGDFEYRKGGRNVQPDTENPVLTKKAGRIS